MVPNSGDQQTLRPLPIPRRLGCRFGGWGFAGQIHSIDGDDDLETLISEVATSSGSD